MTKSYKIRPSIFKRIINNLFGKPKMLEAPVEYTQKEVRKKSYSMIDYCRKRT